MENKELLKKLEEGLEKRFNYKKEGGTILFYNQELKEYDEWGYLILNGYVLSLQENYRHNGTKENKSCEMTICNWNNNRGSFCKRWKVNCGASEKKINKTIEEIVEEYKRLLGE